MSRFVTAKPSGLDSALANAIPQPEFKDYFERIGKYVPGEIIASYTGLNALLATFPSQIQFGSYIFCFLLCWVLTPIYFKLIAKPEDKPSLNYQMGICFFAFLIWAYAIDGGNGLFGSKVLNLFHQSVGGALLIIFSLLTGLLVPKKS